MQLLIFIADDEKSEDYGRQTQLDYFNTACCAPSRPGPRMRRPPFRLIKITVDLKNEKANLPTVPSCSPTEQIVESLKKGRRRASRGDPYSTSATSRPRGEVQMLASCRKSRRLPASTSSG